MIVTWTFKNIETDEIVKSEDIREFCTSKGLDAHRLTRTATGSLTDEQGWIVVVGDPDDWIELREV